MMIMPPAPPVIVPLDVLLVVPVPVVVLVVAAVPPVPPVTEVPPFPTAEHPLARPAPREVAKRRTRAERTRR
jgi:hypothetical protein